jgi:hypothetical protein
MKKSVLTQKELHDLIRGKQFKLSINGSIFRFDNEKIFRDEKELASYKVRVTGIGYFLDIKPLLYDTEDIIVFPKNYNGYCILLNPKADQPFRRFIFLKEI